MVRRKSEQINTIGSIGSPFVTIAMKLQYHLNYFPLCLGSSDSCSVAEIIC